MAKYVTCERCNAMYQVKKEWTGDCDVCGDSVSA